MDNFSCEPYLLEVVVDNFADAIIAEEGGANRLEIVSSPNEEGLSPSLKVVEKIKSLVKIPIRVMVRNKNKFSSFNVKELKKMSEFVKQLSTIGVQGVVIGFLTKDKRIDLDAIKIVLEHKYNLKVTFHRAIDATLNIEDSFKRLIETKFFDRVLTAGGRKSAIEGLATLRKLNLFYSTQINIIVGGSVSAENIIKIKENTGIREYHVGRFVRISQDYSKKIDPSKIKEIINRLHHSS